jgi:CRISPR/Cas system Type II protein with McrA/HNH and RuvC-like nuclease domain
MKNTSGNTEGKIFNLLKKRQINNIHHFPTGARFVSTTYISVTKKRKLSMINMNLLSMNLVAQQSVHETTKATANNCSKCTPDHIAIN